MSVVGVGAAVEDVVLRLGEELIGSVLAVCDRADRLGVDAVGVGAAVGDVVRAGAGADLVGAGAARHVVGPLAAVDLVGAERAGHVTSSPPSPWTRVVSALAEHDVGIGRALQAVVAHAAVEVEIALGASEAVVVALAEEEGTSRERR